LSAPFTQLGMHAGMAATYLLPQAIGLAAARELLFTGRAIDADEALRLGLVNGVYDADELLAGALGIASRVAAAGPIATRLTKAGLRNGGHATIEDALQYEALAQPVTFATDDLREGLAASKERRSPNFTGA
jgi:enoyl-CoA hydratase